jgi:hypothetical protein
VNETKQENPDQSAPVLNERGCYCDLWRKDPDVLRRQGVPEGFCGICEHCRQPGHLRHFPGPVPYTGAWCDRCYRILAWTWPFRIPIGWVFLLTLGTVILFLFQFIKRLFQ